MKSLIKTFSLCLLGSLLGILGFHAYDYAARRIQASRSPSMGGQCYVYKNLAAFAVSDFEVEKVMKVDPPKATVTLAYTFLNQPKFEGHWFCLKTGCEHEDVRKFLDTYELTKCPW